MQSFAQSFAPLLAAWTIDFHDHSVDVCISLAEKSLSYGILIKTKLHLLQEVL